MTISEIIMLIVMVITFTSLGWLFRGWFMFLRDYIKGML